MLNVVQGAATYAYTKIRYGTSPVITRTFRAPAINYMTPMLAERGENRVSDGHTEYLYNRVEETAQIVLMCEPDELQQLRWFFEDWGARGNQFELTIDRLTGSCWTFDDCLRDQNKLNLVLSAGSEAYADCALGRGIVLGSGQYLSVPLAQSSASTITGFDDPLLPGEGVIVIDAKLAFGSSDGALHVIVDTSSGGANRLQLRKGAAGDLTFEVTDASSGLRSVSGAVTWSGNDRVQIIAAWGGSFANIGGGGGTAGIFGTGGLFQTWPGGGAGGVPGIGPLALWYAVNGGAWTQLVTDVGAGTGTLSTLPTTLYLAATNAGASAALGTYDTVSFFKKAFPAPTRTIPEYHPTWRNYLPRAEIQKPWQPQRIAAGKAIWTWPILARNGVA